MAFGDWDSFQFTAGDTVVSASLDVSTPILGSGSLKLGDNSDLNPDFSITMHLNSGFTRGLTKGRIRTIARFDGGWVESAQFIDQMGFGIYYMANNLDINNTASNFYFAGFVRERNVASDVVATIAKATGKTLYNLLWEPGSADILIGSATHLTGVVSGDTLPIQIEWNLDLAGLGGIRHTMSAGAIGETNFSGLSVVYDFVESISPHTVSVIEGVGYMGDPDSNTPIGGATTFDDTGVFQLV